MREKNTLDLVFRTVELYLLHLAISFAVTMVLGFPLLMLTGLWQGLEMLYDFVVPLVLCWISYTLLRKIAAKWENPGALAGTGYVMIAHTCLAFLLSLLGLLGIWGPALLSETAIFGDIVQVAEGVLLVKQAKKSQEGL